jgi:DNA repair protein RecO (recombination protein O)
MEHSEQALVLKANRFRERDMWLKLLTPSRGVITAFAFGGAVSRRRFSGCLDALSLSFFSFKTDRKGYTTLTEGSLKERYPSLRDNPSRLGMAVNCLKFAEAVQPGADGAKSTFELLTAVLSRLDQGGAGIHLPLLFRAKLAFAAGYAPDFSGCQVCGKSVREMQRPHFTIDRARLSCYACDRPSALRLPAGAETVAMLSQIKATDPEEWTGDPLPVRVRRECFDIVESFVEYHLGLRMAGNGFIRA